MTSALSITRSVNPPRAAFLDFPLGHTTGRPHAAAEQRSILRAGLAGFTTIDVPGGIAMLPFSWSDDDAWKDTVMRARADDGSTRATFVRDERTERHDTPQYQSERDRELAERAQREGGCPTCVWLE
jgi:hypothetical protein